MKAHTLKKAVGRWLWIGLTAVLLLTAAVKPIWAQEPGPTPIITEEYTIYQTVTYGEAGVMLALLVVAGLLLINLGVKVAEKLVES